MHIPDDPAAWAQGAAAFRSIFDGLRSAIGMLRDLRGDPRITDQKEGELIDAALDKADKAASIAEAELAKALGFELCKCQFPPTPMLTIGWMSNPNVKSEGPVYECPKCGINTSMGWSFTRTPQKKPAGG